MPSRSETATHHTVNGSGSEQTRLRATACEYILFRTVGGSDESQKSIGVGGARDACVRVAGHGASLVCRRVRLKQNRNPAWSCLESRLGQSAHLCLRRREGRFLQDEQLGAAITASAVLQR